jgi:hypothetical protein
MVDFVDRRTPRKKTEPISGPSLIICPLSMIQSTTTQGAHHDTKVHPNPMFMSPDKRLVDQHSSPSSKQPMVHESHCSCDRKCFLRVPHDQVERHRSMLAACHDQHEKSKIIAAQLADQATIIKPMILQYHFNNQPVCEDAFCFINSISRNKLDSVHKVLTKMALDRFKEAEKHFQVDHESLSPPKKQRKHASGGHEYCEAWILKFLESRRAYIDENGTSYVVDDIAWSRIYDLVFKVEWVDNQGVLPSLKTFLRARDDVLGDNKFTFCRPEDHPVCEACVNFSNQLKNPEATEEVFD